LHLFKNPFALRKDRTRVRPLPQIEYCHWIKFGSLIPLSPFNKNFCRCLTEIKSNWLVISEAGNAVCGVV